MARSMVFQVLVPVLLLLAGIVGMVAWIGQMRWRQARTDALDRLDRLASACSGFSFPRSRPILQVLHDLADAELVLCDQTGTPQRDEAGQLLATLPVQGPLPTLDPPADLDWPSHRWLARRIRLTGPNQVWLVALINRDDIDAAARAATIPVITIGAVVGIPCVALATWLASRLARRVRGIIRQTQRIAQGDFTPIGSSIGTLELEELGSAINTMSSNLTRLQSEIRQVERASLLGQLGAGMAHQVRNAATGARLAVQLHAKTLPAPMPEDLTVAIRQLDLIEMQARQLLEFARPGHRDPAPVDPIALVNDVLALLEPRCRHTGVTVHWQPPAEPIPPLLTDREGLRMALLNLVTNAIEAAGHRGTVRVALVPGPGNSVQFTITDNGPGPSRAIADNLFQPFVTSKPEGVGLGLAVSRRFARDHGGDVTWTRAEGQTTFTLQTRPVEKL